MEFQHLPERKVTTHVGIHDKEQVGISGQYLIAEVVHAAGRAQSTVLLQVPAYQQHSDSTHDHIKPGNN